jgi:uncharacterized protein
MPSATTSWRAIGAYLGLSFGIAWLLWLPLVLGAEGLNLFHFTINVQWVAIGTIGPMLAAIAVSRRTTGRWLPSRFFPPANVGRILALFVAPALMLLTVVVPYILGTQPGTRHPTWSCFAPLLAWMMVLGGPLGEEFGWRGFLLPRLSARLGPTPATLVLGVIWTAWHLPLFLLHTWGHPPLWMFFALLAGASVLMTFGYNLAGGSILAAILAHYTFNVAPQILGALAATAQPRPFPDWYFPIPMALIAIALIVLTRGRLAMLQPYQNPAPLAPAPN